MRRRQRKPAGALERPDGRRGSGSGRPAAGGRRRGLLATLTGLAPLTAVAVLVAAALLVAVAVAPASAAAPWRPPLDGASVTRPFDRLSNAYAAGHRGVDLAGAVGAPVASPAPARVLFVGPVAGRPVVTLDMGGGLRTTYEPVASDLAPGTLLAAGEPFGRLLAGHPGCPVEACLHWGLLRGATYLDPLARLRTSVRLLPLVSPARRG